MNVTDEYNDKMHELIVDRLKERSRKLDIINDCERPSRRLSFRPIIGIAIAACLVGFVFFVAQNRFEEPSTEVMRAGSISVDDLIKDGKYQDAINMLEVELAKSDSTINALNSINGEKDEETEYEIQAEQLKRGDIQEKIKILKKKLK